MLLQEVRRHCSHPVPYRRAVLNHRRPGPYLVIGHQYHGAAATGAMTALAAALQNGCNMIRECHRLGIYPEIGSVIIVRLMIRYTSIVWLRNKTG